MYSVVCFARKNKCPIRRGAFPYCDDFMPSRIDFAKERYGGPFTMSQVEDVKTFLCVIGYFGTDFILEIPSSYILLFLLALHVQLVTICSSKQGANVTH